MFGFQQFHAQTFAGDGHGDLVFQGGELRHFFHGGFEFFFEFVHLRSAHRQCLAGAALRTSCLLVFASRVQEVAAHGLLHVFGRT